MHERFGSGDTDFTPAPLRDDFVMLPPDPLAVLTEVREQRPLFLIEHRRHVDIGVWQEPFGLTAGVDFKEVEEWAPEASPHPRADREHARDLMIHVGVHRPVR